MSDVFIGRQPIFDRNLDVIGYELNYRSFGLNHAEFSDADQATTQIILNSFVEFDLDELVGDKRAFINITRNYSLQKYPIPFPPNRVIMEIVEGKSVDHQLIELVISLIPGWLYVCPG